MKNMRIHCVSSAGCLACLRLVATLTLQSALLLQAQSPVLYSFAGGTSDATETS